MSDMPPALGVILDPSAPPMPEGTAYPVGHVPHRRGPVVTWRMEIHQVELPGQWVCDRRRFVPVDDWEERAAIQEEERASHPRHRE